MMTGLILKDLLNLKQQMKSLLIVLAVWLFISVMNGNGYFFGGFFVMYVVMIPMTTMSMDERSKWERYALTMPVTRTELVLSRYVLSLLTALVGLVLTFIVCWVMSKNPVESLNASLALLCVGVIFASLVLPIIFKMGVDKGRIIMMIVFLVPFLLAFLLPKAGIQPNEAVLAKAIGLVPIAALVLLILSVYVSISIYKKKEF